MVPRLATAGTDRTAPIKAAKPPSLCIGRGPSGGWSQTTDVRVEVAGPHQSAAADADTRDLAPRYEDSYSPLREAQ